MFRFKYLVKLEGGLGNQLFQYAHAVALQSRYGGQIIIDKHAFNKKQIRQCALDHYQIINENVSYDVENVFEKIILAFYILVGRIVCRYNLIRTKKQFDRFVKIGYYHQFQVRCFDSFTKPVAPYNYITGNWLSERFFDGVQEVIRTSLVYKKKLSSSNQELLELITQSESVCIHIRLGDYLHPQWKDKLFVCTPEYYMQAMNLIRSRLKKPKFFVFSNRSKDFEMIRNEYALEDVTYVDMGNTDVEDMELMRNCKHFIMSNSTYSWWAQFLCINPKKIIVAPSRFNNYAEWDMTDIYQKNWDLIEI